ncbi:MAG TPA: hypothetical protein VHO04_00335 [Sphingopyxis sp.]|uniref:tetratricopeptide repeat protein n=1 Tax=Sphingopyxis sp. TaxID=1908224 RepID=UPI002E338539|nr:hypothetical protein [Sphingopyxis sp.]HEX2811099.1 hypothetical protein [Sphingopyxis sp.]
MTATASAARHRLARTFAAALVAAVALFTPATVVASAAADEPADAFALHQAALTAERQGEMTLAIESFDRACAMKLAPSCTMAGLAKLDDANGSEDLMAAARDLATGCLAGSDFACAKMGVALGQAFPGVASAEGIAAIALLQMGEDCRATPNDIACYDAAALLHAEERGGADMSAIQRYAATACNCKAYPGCLPVAALLADESDAAERASAHCLAARADGCITLLAFLLKDEERVKAPDALTILQQACAVQIGIACANLGLFYANGPTRARDDSAARRFMRAGCDGAVAQACFAFAVMHKKGIGGPVHRNRSVELVAHACDLGWAVACETLATIIGDGDASAQPDQDAPALRQRACRLGSENACGAGTSTLTSPV